MENTTREKHTVQFTGKGTEYFKIWIVNILLSLITLGIYSAWAKVRTKRYFYGNTLLNDAPFEYHATPKQILIGRIIALVLLVVYVVTSETMPTIAGVVIALLFLATPWIIYRSVRFNTRMSSHRNVRFDFKGTALPFYKYLFLYPILPGLLIGLIGMGLYFVGVSPSFLGGIVALSITSFYLAFPWAQRNITEYVTNHYRYGQGQFSTRPALSTRIYYLRYLVAFLLSAVLLAIFAGIAYKLGYFDALAAFNSTETDQADPQVFSQLSSFFILAYAALFFVGFVGKAYVQSGIRKHVFANTKLDNLVGFSSSVTTGKLFLLLITNFLLLIVTLGFGYPWIKVRLARYFANNSHVYTNGELNHYVTQQQEKQSALGEELGDVFDVDMDLGL